MRVLVVHPGPFFSVADVHRGWIKGLQANGCTVVDYNLGDRLSFYSEALLERDGEIRPALSSEAAAHLAAKGIETACYELWPNLVVIVSGFFVPPAIYELMRNRGHKVVLLHTESPYEDDRQLERAPYADLNVLNDPTNIDRFPNAVYIPHAYDPDVHKPRDRDPDVASEFCFVGTGFASRIEFFEAVDWAGIDVALGGNWQQLAPDSPLRKFLAHDIDECCPNDETARLYASSKASVNLYRKEASFSAEGWAMGPREVELAATGTFFLREPRGEGDEVLSMLPTFGSPAEFEDSLRWWLRRDRLREQIAAEARGAVADRTFANHAARLLSLL